MYDNQTLLVDQLENRRESTSGVSLDEEMANMIKYQHSYTAAARIINTMDEMLDLIVNRLGLVGR
jgi:flagellar hook-associated protein 1 FlgK